MIRKLKPGSSSRAKILDKINKKLVASKEYWKESIVIDKARWEHLPKLGSYSGRLLHLFGQSMNVTVASMLDGTADSNEQLRQAIGYGFWGVQIEPHALQEMIGDDEFNFSHPELESLCCAYGIFANMGLYDVVDWMSKYLNRTFCNPHARDVLAYTDLSFARFMAELMRIKTEGSWPDYFDETRFGAYYGILNTAREPSKFKEALPEYCDFRWANVLGYASVDANRRKSEGDAENSIYYGDVWQSLIPFELFTLQYVYESVTGNKMDLYAEHLLLKPDFIELPRVKGEIYQDEWTKKAVHAASGFLNKDDWQFFDSKGKANKNERGR